MVSIAKEKKPYKNPWVKGYEVAITSFSSRADISKPFYEKLQEEFIRKNISIDELFFWGIPEWGLRLCGEDTAKAANHIYGNSQTVVSIFPKELTEEENNILTAYTLKGISRGAFPRIFYEEGAKVPKWFKYNDSMILKPDSIDEAVEWVTQFAQSPEQKAATKKLLRENHLI